MPQQQKRISISFLKICICLFLYSYFPSNIIWKHGPQEKGCFVKVLVLCIRDRNHHPFPLQFAPNL